MRILVLSHFYDPEPLPKPSDLAQALAQRGHIVSVITGLPNYPSGELYSGYRLRLLHRERIAGIPVIRTLTFPYHGSSSLGRIINYASFMISAVLGALFAPPCDLIYVWHPPLTTGLAAWAIGLIKRAPFVYDVQDIWPESLTASGKVTNPWLVWVMHLVERFIYGQAQHLLVVTHGARDNLVGKGVPPSKVSVAGLWIDESRFLRETGGSGADVRRQYGFGDRFVVMYAGNMGYLQGLDTVLSCAQVLGNEKKIVFALVGDGVDRERLVTRSGDLALSNVVFVESQPTSVISSFLSAADALLVHLKDSEVNELVIPGKTLAYLASGRPIIMATNGASADLIKRAQAGLVIAPENPTEMAEAVLDLFRLRSSERDSLGQRGRQYLLTYLSRDRMLQCYEEIFEQASKR